MHDGAGSVAAAISGPRPKRSGFARRASASRFAFHNRDEVIASMERECCGGANIAYTAQPCLSRCRCRRSFWPLRQRTARRSSRAVCDSRHPLKSHLRRKPAQLPRKIDWRENDSGYCCQGGYKHAHWNRSETGVEFAGSEMRHEHKNRGAQHITYGKMFEI